MTATHGPAGADDGVRGAPAPGGSGGDVRETVLPSGVHVVTEAVDGVRSATVGVWTPTGSRDERPVEAGAAHFLEHLLFKGTGRRSAQDIAEALDSVGGESNAFTSHEYTCFYARVLDRDLPLATDVVLDQVTSSRVRAEDVDAERTVVLEEIAMRDDDPADLSFEQLGATVFGDTPLGRPVLGTVDSIGGMTRDVVAGFWESHYTNDRLVVAVAGSLEHGAVVADVEAALERAGRTAPAASAASRTESGRSDAPRAREAFLEKQTEQANVALGVVTGGRDDPRRHALAVLTTVLGGGTSSRLFQEVREKRGLVYTVGATTLGFREVGVLAVYAGCTPRHLDEVLRVCRGQLEALAADGITDAELRRARGQVRGATVLGLEDTAARMSRLGKGVVAGVERLDVDEVLARVDAVTGEDVQALAAELFADAPVVSVVGPAAAGRVLEGAAA